MGEKTYIQEQCLYVRLFQLGYKVQMFPLFGESLKLPTWMSMALEESKQVYSYISDIFTANKKFMFNFGASCLPTYVGSVHEEYFCE
jgi:hypothetical protein